MRYVQQRSPAAMCVSRSTSGPRISRNRSSSAWQAAPLSAATRWIAQLRSTRRMTPSAPMTRLGEVALLVLDDRQLARPVDEARLRRQAIGHALPDPVAGHPPALVEDAVDELLAADRPDRRQQAAGETVVVGREEVLGRVGDVVHVARPADAVADGLAADEPGGLERVELLEDAGPAHAEPGGEVLGRARPVVPQAEQQRPSQVGRSHPRSRGATARHGPARRPRGGR